MNLNLNVNKNFDEVITQSRKDIWRYATLLGDVKNENFVDPQQSDFTPIEQLGEWSVKREDQSVVGSHKFRGITYQLSCLLEQNIKHAVLSSSGNAAIAASRILPENANLKLFVFLSKQTPAEKLAALKFSPNFIPILSERPLRMLKYVSKHFKMTDLRPSQDPNAVTGFRSLGFEIFEQKPDIENIFSFATSFASVRGIAEAFEALIKMGARKQMPKIYAATPRGQLTIGLDRQDVDKSRHMSTRSRHNNLSSRQQSTQVDISRQKFLSSRQANFPNVQQVDISDNEISLMKDQFSSLDTSNEGFASLAAAEKIKPVGESLVILTGKNWQDGKVDVSKFETADNFVEVDKIMF